MIAKAQNVRAVQYILAVLAKGTSHINQKVKDTPTVTDIT